MRHVLGALIASPLLIAVLSGCGADDETVRDPAEASGPASTSTTPPDDEPALDYDAELVHATGGAGPEDTTLLPVDDAKQADRFLARFRIPEFRDTVRTTIAAARADGVQVYAAVVEVSCDVPPGVDVTRDGDALDVTAHEVADPRPECYAPVTTVAVVSVRA